MRSSQIVNLGDIVRRFFPHYIAKFSAVLEYVGCAWRWEENSSLSAEITKSGRKSGIKVMKGIYRECVELELMASAKTAEKIIRLYKDKTSSYREQTALVDELKERITDELEGHFFLSMSPSEADRYDNWDKDWAEILTRFGEATRDVEEMNKCFALSRYTASMFHALHVAEWGSICLGDFIGVTDPKKGWGPTAKKLRELVDGGHSSLPATLTGKFEFLEQMNREIDSMVLAWRHKVDHAANHLAIVPNTDFTPDIAEHIIGAVRIFMQRLLEGIPV